MIKTAEVHQKEAKLYQQADKTKNLTLKNILVHLGNEATKSANTSRSKERGEGGLLEVIIVLLIILVGIKAFQVFGESNEGGSHTSVSTIEQRHDDLCKSGYIVRYSYGHPGKVVHTQEKCEL